jgi:AcrR family transcriptional regulator
MTTASTRQRPGRPRSATADVAILAAALELLIERGVGAVSIEQVAQRAGVTRATVYRRFPGKIELLIAAIESLHIEAIQALHGADPPDAIHWRDVEHMLAEWAHYLSQPRERRMLRRLYAATDEYPEIRHAYWNAHGEHRSAAVRSVLEQAHDRGQFPPDVDVDVIEQVLHGATLYELGRTSPGARSPHQITDYLTSVLRQTGYRPAGRDGTRGTQE